MIRRREVLTLLADATRNMLVPPTWVQPSAGALICVAEGDRKQVRRSQRRWNFFSSGRIMLRYAEEPHASDRDTPGRWDVFLSPLRSIVFGDAFATFQE
jgi:hypothetical protein